VCEPVPLFDISQPTLSHHPVAALRQIAIVATHRVHEHAASALVHARKPG
jgi:hypothetical protein